MIMIMNKKKNKKVMNKKKKNKEVQSFKETIKENDVNSKEISFKDEDL